MRILDADRIEVIERDGTRYLRVAEDGRVFEFEENVAHEMALAVLRDYLDRIEQGARRMMADG